MNAAALILGLLGAVVVLAWLAGRAVRVPAPACSQNCRQGRGCNCCRGVAALAPEEIAP